MLIAIVLDKPLSEAQALLDDPDAFMLEITKIIQNKHAHPVIAQMLHPDVRDDLPPSECATASSEGQSSHTVTTNHTQSQTQFPCIDQLTNMGYPWLVFTLLANIAFGVNLVCLTSLLTLDPSHRRFRCCLTTSVTTRLCRC